MNNMEKVKRILKPVFYFGTTVLNKLIILLCYNFMFIDQITFLESSYIPALKMLCIRYFKEY